MKVADELEACLDTASSLKDVFQQSEGITEFQADGTCVNTRDEAGKQEWREFKTGVFVKGPLADSAVPRDWDKRELAKAKCVFAFGAIEAKEEFQ